MWCQDKDESIPDGDHGWTNVSIVPHETSITLGSLVPESEVAAIEITKKR